MQGLRLNVDWIKMQVLRDGPRSLDFMRGRGGERFPLPLRGKGHKEL